MQTVVIYIQVNVTTNTPYFRLYYFIPVSILVLNEAATAVTANVEEAVGCINCVNFLLNR